MRQSSLTPHVLLAVVMFVVVTALVLLSGCAAAESESVAQITPDPEGWMTNGVYSQEDLDAAVERLDGCEPREGWPCGVILATVDAGIDLSDDWTAILARPDGSVAVITQTLSSTYESEVTEALFPPGSMIRWDASDGDIEVDPEDEVELVGLPPETQVSSRTLVRDEESS